MIYFFAGLLTGVVLALAAVRYLGRTNTQPEAISDEQAGLNSEEEDAKEMLAELNRQFVRVMQYTGKEQRKKE